MKAYQRREAGKLVSYNLDVWDEGRCCWTKTTRRGFDTVELARKAATAPGRYRLSRATDGRGREELEPFEVV